LGYTGLHALRALALDKQICFLPTVAFGQGDGWDQNIVQTGGLTALLAFEMYVIVMVVILSAGCSTKGILRVARIVEHFMHNAFVEKGAQRPVDRNPIMVGPKAQFDIAMPQRMVGLQE
jgi:hypothetical protein